MDFLWLAQAHGDNNLFSLTTGIAIGFILVGPIAVHYRKRYREAERKFAEFAAFPDRDEDFYQKILEHKDVP